MANESTKTTQTSVRMAKHNERTRLQDLHTYKSMCALVMPTLFTHCVEPSACTLVCVVFVDSLAIPTSPNIVNIFVSCSFTFCQVT